MRWSSPSAIGDNGGRLRTSCTDERHRRRCASLRATSTMEVAANFAKVRPPETFARSHERANDAEVTDCLAFYETTAPLSLKTVDSRWRNMNSAPFLAPSPPRFFDDPQILDPAIPEVSSDDVPSHSARQRAILGQAAITAIRE
jgi:hypothetical protein